MGFRLTTWNGRSLHCPLLDSLLTNFAVNGIRYVQNFWIDHISSRQQAFAQKPILLSTMARQTNLRGTRTNPSSGAPC